MGCVSRLESLESRRLLSNSDLDVTFGHAGRLGVDLGRRGGFEDMVLQPDGKILAVGTITSPSGRTSDAMALRFNPDGSFDTSFGEGGLVRFDRGGHEDFQSIVLRSDGGFFAGGQLNGQAYALLAYNAVGSIDTTFGGGDGVTEVSGWFADLALQSDKILSVTAGGKLRRHNADGSVDTSFAGGNFIDIGPLFEQDGGAADVQGAHATVRTIIVEPSGFILLGGQVGFSVDGDSLEESVLYRLAPDGAYDWDETFGVGNVVEQMAVQSDGKILASVEGGMYRLNPDGSGDTTFGELLFPGTSRADVVGGSGGIAVQPDGKIVTADELSAKRLLSDGSPDESFSGGDGTSTDLVDGEFAIAGALAMASDGGILVGGTTGFSDDARRIATIAKFVANPAPAMASNVRLADGKLHIEGSADGDFVTLTSDGNAVRLEMNGEAMTFDLADVQLVTAAMGEGDDTFQVLGNFPRPVTIHGEVGNDYIRGGNRDDYLTGGDGFDRLNGWVGDDTLFGGADRDLVAGSDGNDWIDGGAHDDELDGGSGIDTLFGQSGSDWFKTIDQMMDSLFGGPGNDRVDGDPIDELASVEQAGS
jgi:uncharacterized delta-60 repeat protein